MDDILSLMGFDQRLAGIFLSRLTLLTQRTMLFNQESNPTKIQIIRINEAFILNLTRIGIVRMNIFYAVRLPTSPPARLTALANRPPRLG